MLKTCEIRSAQELHDDVPASVDSIFSSDVLAFLWPQRKDLREKVRTPLRQVGIPHVGLGDSPGTEGEVAKRIFWHKHLGLRPDTLPHEHFFHYFADSGGLG